MNAVFSLAGFGAKCKTKEKRTMNSDKGSANVDRAERCSNMTLRQYRTSRWLDFKTASDLLVSGPIVLNMAEHVQQC